MRNSTPTFTKKQKIKITRGRSMPWIAQCAGVFVLTLLTLLTVSKDSFLSPHFVSPIPIGSLKSVLRTDENLTALLQQNNIASASVVTDGDTFVVKLSGGEEVLFSAKKELQPQISSLQLIYSRLTIEGKRFSRLDFRFDKPVITLR